MVYACRLLARFNWPEASPIGANSLFQAGGSDMKSVLVVDDQQDFRVLMSSGIKRQFAAEVIVAQSGFEAISYIETLKFDLIVADLNMANGTGLDIANYLVAQQLHIPFALFTCQDRRTISIPKYDNFMGIAEKTNLNLLVNMIHDQLGWKFKT